MAAQHPVELRTQPLDRCPAGEVEEVGAELNCHATQLVECVAQHQQLRLGVDSAAPRRRDIPGVADLEPAVGRVDIEVARRPDQGAVEAAHHERQTRSSGAACPARASTHWSAACGFGAAVNHRLPTSPSAAASAISGTCATGQGFQRYPTLPGQCHRFDEAGSRCSPGRGQRRHQCPHREHHRNHRHGGADVEPVARRHRRVHVDVVVPQRQRHQQQRNEPAPQSMPAGRTVRAPPWRPRRSTSTPTAR